MINLFKNFQTKKQLREENEKLKMRIDTLLYATRPVHIDKYKLITINSRLGMFKDKPMETAKAQLSHRIAEQLISYADWNIEDASGVLFDKIITGTIQLAVKK